MAITGASKIVLADYTVEGNNVVYKNLVVQENQLASYSAEIEQSDDNSLYLDNGIAETDKGTFKSGTFTLGTGDLTDVLSKSLYKIKTKQYTPKGGSKAVTASVYDDTFQSLEKGIGVIEEHKVNNKYMYRAQWFNRVMMSVPKDSATTRGESIDWQTKEISGTIYRSAATGENGVHPWKETADFETEAEALEFLKSQGTAAEAV